MAFISLFTRILLSNYLIVSIMNPIEIVNITAEFLSLLFIKKPNAIFDNFILFIRFITTYHLIGLSTLYSMIQMTKSIHMIKRPALSKVVQPQVAELSIPVNHQNNTLSEHHSASQPVTLNSQDDGTVPTSIHEREIPAPSNSQDENIVPSTIEDQNNAPSTDNKQTDAIVPSTSNSFTDVTTNNDQEYTSVGKDDAVSIAAVHDQNAVYFGANKQDAVSTTTNDIQTTDIEEHDDNDAASAAAVITEQVTLTYPVNDDEQHSSSTIFRQVEPTPQVVKEENIILTPAKQAPQFPNKEREVMVRAQVNSEQDNPSATMNEQDVSFDIINNEQETPLLENDKEQDSSSENSMNGSRSSSNTMNEQEENNKEEYYKEILENNDNDIIALSNNLQRIFDEPLTPIPNESTKLFSSNVMDDITPALTPPHPSSSSNAGSTLSRKSSVTSQHSQAFKSRLQLAMQKVARSGPRQSASNESIEVNQNGTSSTASKKSLGRFSSIKLTNKRKSKLLNDQYLVEKTEEQVSPKRSISTKFQKGLKNTGKRFSKIFS